MSRYCATTSPNALPGFAPLLISAEILSDGTDHGPLIVFGYLSIADCIDKPEATKELKRKMVDDERGEGPVSAAIVVMIMAFLGVALWIAFKAIMHQATTTVATQVSQLGQ